MQQPNTVTYSPPLAQANPDNISAQLDVAGNVSGQLAIGKQILQIGSLNGGVVKFGVGSPSEPKPRTGPIFHLPRPFNHLIGRQSEQTRLKTHLHSESTLELYGQPGIGKSVLSRHFCHQISFDPAFPDGVIYHSVQQSPVSDTAQFLFELFYESDRNLKATEAQLHQALGDKQALILLDDMAWESEAITYLIHEIAPHCTFLLLSHQRRLWGEGTTQALTGLESKFALELIEREMERSLSAVEQAEALSLCQLLEGHPLSILQAVASCKIDQHSFAEMVHQLRLAANLGQSTHIALLQNVLQPLKKQHRWLLGILAVLFGIAIAAKQASGMSLERQAADLEAGPLLDELVRRHLVVQDGQGSYQLANNLPAYLEQAWQLAPQMEQVLDYCDRYLQTHQSLPNFLASHPEKVVTLVEKGVQQGHFLKAWQLGRSVEGSLILGRQWGAWEQLLNAMKQAAQDLGNTSLEAWVLHEQGTRLLCLGESSTAMTALMAALRLRQMLGETDAAGVTLQNLGLLPSFAPEAASPGAKLATSLSLYFLPGLAGVFLTSFMVAIALRAPTPLTDPPINPRPDITDVPSVEPSSNSELPIPFPPAPIPFPPAPKPLTPGTFEILLPEPKPERPEDREPEPAKQESPTPEARPDDNAQDEDGEEQEEVPGGSNTDKTHSAEDTPKTGETVVPPDEPAPPLPLPNLPPQANDDSLFLRSPEELASINVIDNDEDPEGDQLTLVAVQPLDAGSESSQNISFSANGTVNYIKSQSGITETFEYVIEDPLGERSTAVLTVVSNGRPIASDDRFSIPYDAPFTFNLLDNDEDPDGDRLEVVGLRRAESVIIGSATAEKDGRFTYTPDDGGVTDIFEYTVQDQHGEEDTATVTIIVTNDSINPTNLPPEAKDATYTLSSEQDLEVNLFEHVNNPEDKTLKLLEIKAENVSMGSEFDFTAEGDFFFYPGPNIGLAPGEPLSDTPLMPRIESFSYQVVDEAGNQSTAMLTITVELENMTPLEASPLSTSEL